jgi:divalent metal cation (Fe/Co/Zn/Cd) transporter
MESNNLPVYMFNTRTEAEDGIRALNRAGIDMKTLSLVGKGVHSEEHAVGFYSAGDRIKSWGGTGAFWGSIWGLMFAPAVFFLPGLGLVALAGPLVAMLVSALEGAVLVGGVSALVAALTDMGVPQEQAIKYETALKVDKYVLLLHGPASDVDHAKSVLSKYLMASS